MKKLKTAVVFIVLILTHTCFTQVKNDSLDSFMKMRDSLMNTYTNQYQEMNRKIKEQQENKKGFGSNYFSLNLDVIFGLGFSKTEFDITKDTAGLSNINSKTGPMLGVNINFNLMGFALSTGFNYSSKGFSSNSNSFNANYFNIPLLLAFNFNIRKVEIDLAAGPYLGILMSHDNNQYYSLKNIDIGLTGSIQGSYFFNRFIGSLIGVKYERGGLNNLLESNGLNNYVSSVKTQNWFVYTGLKFVL